MSRKHRYRLQRDYQFPAARRTLEEGLRFAWIVGLQYDPAHRLYAVVRYWLHGETRCWLESPDHFEDVVSAEAWIREQFAALKAEGYQ